jgi:hypothetical protein
MSHSAEPRLRVLQRWMSEVIRHPADSDTAAQSETARALVPRGQVVAGQVIKPSPKGVPPLHRLDVYNGGYLSRLIEVLEGDFDAVKHALGDGWFEVAKRYVYAHPSRHPNLNQFGKHFPGFLAEQHLPHRGFVVDLARLQWAVVESFDSPEFTPLDVTALGSLTQEQWAGAVLRCNPSVRLVRFDWPVHRYLQRFYDGEQPGIEKPATTHVLCYRKEGRVWRLRLPDAMAAILAALMEGQPFARALEAATTEHEENVGSWFQEWAADGVFVGVELPFA